MSLICFTQWSQPHAVQWKHYKMKLSISSAPWEAVATGKHLNTVYGHSSSKNTSARPYLCRQHRLLNQHLTVGCVRERDCPLQASMPDQLCKSNLAAITNRTSLRIRRIKHTRMRTHTCGEREQTVWLRMNDVIWTPTAGLLLSRYYLQLSPCSILQAQNIQSNIQAGRHTDPWASTHYLKQKASVAKIRATHCGILHRCRIKTQSHAW